MVAKCPFCGKAQKKKPLKSWTYGRMIEKRDESGTKWGTIATVSRYLCDCGKPFNFFFTKGLSWTIPKKQLSKPKVSKVNTNKIHDQVS